MKFLSLGALLVASAATVGAAQQGTVAAPTVQDDNEITLTGCVIKGDGGYVLSVAPHLKIESTTVAGTSGVAVPPATAPGPTVLYWLKDDDDIDEHAGHRVEVKGKLDKEIDRGMISHEIENGLIELEFKANNRKVTVKVPQGSVVAAPVATAGVTTVDKEKDLPITVRPVDVKSVKMLSSTCGG